jgi:hypothetical protein
VPAVPEYYQRSKFWRSDSMTRAAALKAAAG